MMKIKRPLSVLALTATLGTMYIIYRQVSLEKNKRKVKFWYWACRLYISYKTSLVGLSKEAREKKLEKLHVYWAPIMLKVVHQLGGFYIKAGQEMGTNTDWVPKPYADQFRTLEDAVPPRTFQEVKETIESEIGKPLNSLFIEFDEKPVGSASIGQVHRAILRETNQEVAVKVQYKSIEDIFRRDFTSLKRAISMLYKPLLATLDEYESQFLSEFNYEIEASNLHEARTNTSRYKNVVVPRPYLEYCTKRMLVMEYLKGTKLVTALEKEIARYAASQNKTVAELQEEMAKGVNSFNTTEIAKEVLHYKVSEVLNSAKTIAYNLLYGWWVRQPKTIVQVPQPLFMRASEILRTLFDVHGRAILVDGFFNGDPHPGNILLLEDGRIGLIDFGQVKRLNKEERLELAKLYVAICDDKRDDIVSIMLRTGHRSKKNLSNTIYVYALSFYDKDCDAIYGGKNRVQFWQDIEKEDPYDTIPKQYVMVMRVVWLLRLLSLSLGYDYSCAKMFEPIARSVVKETQ